MKQDWTCPSCKHFVYGDDDFCGCGTLRPEYGAYDSINSSYVPSPAPLQTPKNLSVSSEYLGATLVAIAWFVGISGVLAACLIGYQATFGTVDGRRFTMDSPVLYFLAAFLPVGFVAVVMACLLAFCGRTLQVLSGIYQSVNLTEDDVS